jgi:hypothetical protein
MTTSHPSPTRRGAGVVVVGVVLALLAGGCGGGAGAGVASLARSSSGPPTAAQLQRDQQAATSFARCMRGHGVAVPDPTAAPRAFKNTISALAPASRAAYASCAHLLPPGRPTDQSPARTRAQVAALLAFARCLRQHGFPSFPDPTSGGDLTREMLAGAGVDIHTPAVVRAADICTSVTHGVITRAVVAHFVAGQ